MKWSFHERDAKGLYYVGQKLTCWQDTVSILTHKYDGKASVAFRCYQFSAIT